MRRLCVIAIAVIAIMTVLPAAGQNRPAGWIADARTGCRVWNPAPDPDESVTWEGPCVNGFAHGKGVLRWYSAGKLTETDSGDFRNGKLNGYAVVVFESGRRFEGQWRDQRPNGRGTLKAADGQVFSGQWRNGCFNEGGRRATQNSSAAECGFR